MKAFTGTLGAYLADMQGRPDATLHVAECFTFTLRSGNVLRFTNADVAIVYLGNTFACDGPLIDGLKYHATVGVNVDEQQMTVAARPGYQLAGAAFVGMLEDGAFDLCRFRRERVFFRDHVGGEVVGGVVLFEGRFARIEDIGEIDARITVADDLVDLEAQMPRNSYQATCNRALYDSGCGLKAQDFTTAALAGEGSTQLTLHTPAALFAQIGGYVEFTGGANAGVRATIKNVRVGREITLVFPLPDAVATGDAFNIVLGCDRTLPTCAGTFNNRARFRGFPFVPPMQYAQ
ncbi:MAG: DUF2163 domain-containing protein [Rhodoblastus sp.]